MQKIYEVDRYREAAPSSRSCRGEGPRANSGEIREGRGQNRENWSLSWGRVQEVFL